MSSGPHPTRRAVLAGAALLAAAPARAAAPRFEVVGAELRWGGAPVRLKGVAVGDPILIRAGRPTSDYRLIADGWNSNVARISLHPGHWRADRSGALRALERDVAAARAAGLFVILDWHAIGFPGRYTERPGAGWGLPEDAYSADLALAVSFWTQAAQTFGRDPGVIFELWNEPVVDPKLWVSTGQHWPLLRATWLQLIAAVRRHSDALVLAAGGRWAHDLRGVAADPLDDPRTAYSWHAYPQEERDDAGGWAGSLGGLDAVKPVVVTEWGFCSPCDVAGLRGTADDFGRAFTRDVLDARGLHSTAWSWSATATPAMLDADWTTPNAYGRFVLGYLAAPPAGRARPAGALR